MREWRKPHNEELIDLYSSSNLFGRPNEELCDGRGLCHIWERGEEHVGFCFRGKTQCKVTTWKT